MNFGQAVTKYLVWLGNYMKTTILSVSLSLLAFSANANPFVGTYLPQSEKENGATCESLAGSFDGRTPYRIEENRIEFLESGCDLKKPKIMEDESIRYQAFCAAEGNDFRDTLTIGTAENGIIVKGEGWEEYWQQCPSEMSDNSDGSAIEPLVSYKPNEVRCYMDIKGKVIVDGPCDVDDMGDGMVNFDVQGDNLSNINTDGKSMSAWNGGSGYRVTTPLGVLTKQGDYCYTNQNVVVCFGMKK